MERAAFGFFHPFRVRYSEIDLQGVVFNAHYLTYFDTAITEYFRTLGVDIIAEAKATGVDFHTVRSLVEYKAPILLDQEIEVGCRAARLGRASLTLALAIFAKGEGRLLASGEIVWVNTDQRTHKAVPVGARLREILRRKEGASLTNG
jgi:acyl-CoA thioester hydrolase